MKDKITGNIIYILYIYSTNKPFSTTKKTFSLTNQISIN